MSSEPITYDGVDRHVKLQVVPIRMRWTEWRDALLVVLESFYEDFETVQLGFSVHNSTGGTIGRGFVQEVL